MNGETLTILPLATLTLGAVGLGGGLYETLLVDPVWPRNPALIQPSRGGLDRKRFWGPVHILFEVVLLVAVWRTWSNPPVRPWMVAALATHFAARGWSFAYFIPRAIRFEKMGDLSEDQIVLARRWVALSRLRPLLELAAVASLGAAVIASAGG